MKEFKDSTNFNLKDLDYNLKCDYAVSLKNESF